MKTALLFLATDLIFLFTLITKTKFRKRSLRDGNVVSRVCLPALDLFKLVH